MKEQFDQAFKELKEVIGSEKLIVETNNASYVVDDSFYGEFMQKTGTNRRDWNPGHSKITIKGKDKTNIDYIFSNSLHEFQSCCGSTIAASFYESEDYESIMKDHFDKFMNAMAVISKALSYSSMYLILPRDGEYTAMYESLDKSYKTIHTFFNKRSGNTCYLIVKEL